MPLFRRFGRPGLLGAVARTAVVAGTATMTARAVSRGMDNRDRTRAEAAQYENQQRVSEQTVPVAAESITSQLATLSSLKASGAISDDEFALAKQRVLGS